MDGMKLGPIGPVAELLERVIAEALEPQVMAAREEAWRQGFDGGYVTGRRDEREAWRARLRHLLGDLEQDTTAGVAGAAAFARPPTQAGGIAPAKAAEEEADGEAGAATAASSCDAAAPQPIGRPANTGGEPPAPPEPPAAEHDDDEDGQQEGFAPPCAPEVPGPSPAAAAGAPPEVPGASPAAAGAPVWQDWRTEARHKRLLVLWPQLGLSLRDMWDDLRRIDGPAMPGDAANLTHWAKKLNLPTRAAAAAKVAALAPKAPAEEQGPPATEVAETPAMVRARELLAMGLHPNDIKSAVRLTATEFATIGAAWRAKAA